VRAKRRNRRFWIAAVATVGVAGGVYAAEQAAPAGDDELARTITAQRISDAQSSGKPPSEHQVEALTPDQLLVLGVEFGKEMKSTGEHVESLRIEAYRSRDLIRMTCIESKVEQIAIVIKLSEPRIADMPRVQGERLLLQERFVVIHQARERVNELAREAEDCTGDNLSLVSLGRMKDEIPPEGEDVYDPTRPPAPGIEISRPPEASPYR